MKAIGMALAITLVLLAWSATARAGDIFHAIHERDLEKVKTLLKGNINLVNAKDDGFGSTPLHIAAAYDKGILEFLLAQGAKVNAKNNLGDTPMHNARSKEIAEILLSHGADANAKNSSGDTPLHCAAGNGHKDVVEFLLAHGTDVNVKNSSGETPLHLAALIGNKDVVEFLLTHGADVSATDAFGYTPLKHAENKDIADILLSHMSDANVKDKVFNQYISDLQNTPGDNHLREVIIALAQKEKLVPDVPAEANADFIKANTFMKAAKNTSDYKYAIEAYKKALLEAPWWGNAYYNLGMALEAAGQNDDAVESLKLYILTKSSEADIAQTKTKIIEIQAKGELAEKKEADLRAKYGGNDAPGSFNFDSLFRYGAVVQDMSFDASGSARTISLKIQTRKENGRLLNYLAIFDITSKEDTFGQTFSADWRGTQTFYGDDRTRPGKYSMTLTVTSFGDGDAKISIRPSNNASASIQTTLADLFRERARQAVYGGQQDVKVGDKTFYVIGEGGSKQALLYFPAEIKDKLEHGEVRDLSPMFVAIVNYRGPDGKSKAFAKSDLGIVNGTHYHLELDENDVWTAKIGEGPAN